MLQQEFDAGEHVNCYHNTAVSSPANRRHLCCVFSTSMKYSRTSSYRGTRLMALCDVALGRCHDTCHHDTTLTQPPNDFDSVHGIKHTDDVASDFTVSTGSHHSVPDKDQT